MKRQHLLQKAAHLVLVFVGALWLLFEDWVWDSILSLMKRVGRLSLIARCETFLAQQNPYVLLSLFAFPFFIMIPAKLFGLYLIASGKVLRGVAIFVIAKVTVTALVTRLFMISKDKLLLIPSFASFYYWMKEKKEWLYAEVRKLPAWQAARDVIHKLRSDLKSMIRSLRKG